MGAALSEGRILRNTSKLLVAQGFGYVVSFVFGIVVARILGVSPFGRFAYYMAIYGLLGILVHLGLQKLTVREISRERARAGEFFEAVLRLKLPVGFLCLVGLTTWAFLTQRGPGETPWPFVFIGVALVLDGVSDAVTLLFHGFERFGEAALIGLVGGLLVALFGTGVLIAGGGPAALVGSMVVAKLVQAIVFVRVVRRRLPAEATRLRGTAGPLARKMLVQAVPFLMTKAFFMIFFRIDAVMLEAMSGDEAVGLYGCAYRFVNVSVAAAGALTAAVFPEMAATAMKDRNRYEHLARLSLKGLAAVGILVGATLAVAPRAILTLLYTDVFAPAAPALALLAGAIVGVFIHHALSNAVVANNRERWAIPFGAAAALLNVALNLWLIPTHREVGAAWATLICQALLVLGYTLIAVRDVQPARLLGPVVHLLPSAAVLVGTLLLLDAWPIWLGAPAAFAAFVVALLATGAMGREDLQRLRAALPQRRART